MNPELIIEIEQSKINIPTLKVNNYYIHSKYNPLKEAEQFAQRNYEEGTLHILFGNGLGYYADAFFNLAGNEEGVVVFDPIEGLESKYKPCTKFDLQSFQKTLGNKFGKWRTFKVICLPNYGNLFPEQYKKLLSYTRDKIAVTKIFENTVYEFSNQWQENYLKNLKFISRDCDIHELEEKTNVPVIVASAGPSLAKQIPVLKENRNKYLLVAAGSTITALMKHELEPDFIVTMDGGEWNYNHFINLQLTKAKLVYSLVSHFKIRENFKGEAYHYLSTDCYEMENHYQNLTNNNPVKLLGGASVATYAVAFARYISNGPITLVGQDLAYTNNYTHDPNNNHAFQLSNDYIQQRGIFKTVGYNNDEVLTDHAFLAMKEVFESIYKDLDGNDLLFNSTEGGLNLDGYVNIPLTKFMRQFLGESVHLNSDDKYANRLNLDEIIGRLQKELLVYNDGIILLNENLTLVKSTLPLRKFKQSTLNKIDKNEKKLIEMSEQLAVGIAIKKVILDVMTNYQPEKSETEYMKYKRVYEQNEALNTQLLQLFIKTKQIIHEIVESKGEKIYE